MKMGIQSREELPVKIKKLNIGILDHSGEIGGAETSILTLLKNYNSDQFNLKMILSAKGRFFKLLREMGVETFLIPLSSPLRNLKRKNLVSSFFLLLTHLFAFNVFLLRLRNVMIKGNFDLLMTNTIKAHIYGSLASLWLKTPLIWRFHDILNEEDFHPLYIKSIVFLGNRFPKQILAVSEETRTSLIRQGIRSNKVKTLYNGVEIKNSQGQEEIKSILVEKEKKGAIIGCFGRIVPQKGHRVLLSSVPRVLSSFPQTKFLIAGDTPETYQSYRTKLMEIIQEKGLKENVFLLEFCPNLHSLYRSIDILVLPSVTPEAFGLTLLEAMAFGKPVIASRIGGVRELIEEEINGFLVEPNDDEGLADRIRYLIENPGVCKQMGEKAKEIVQKKFPLKKYIEGMEESFINIIHRKGEGI